MRPAQLHQDTQCSLAAAQPFHSSSLNPARQAVKQGARQFSSTCIFHAAVWKADNSFLATVLSPQFQKILTFLLCFSGEQTIFKCCFIQLTTLLSFSLKMKFRHYIFSTYTAGGALLEVLTAFTEQCTDITPTSFPVKAQYI